MLTFLLHGWRSWKSAKPIAFLAIFALALGIGSATAIYTVVQTELLSPFPYKNPDLMYSVRGTYRAMPGWQASLSYADLLDFVTRQKTASTFGCVSPGSYNIFYNHSALHVSGLQLSPALAVALGVPPRIGRWFQDEKHEPFNHRPDAGHQRQAIYSHRHHASLVSPASGVYRNVSVGTS